MPHREAGHMTFPEPVVRVTTNAPIVLFSTVQNFEMAGSVMVIFPLIVPEKRSTAF